MSDSRMDMLDGAIRASGSKDIEVSSKRVEEFTVEAFRGEVSSFKRAVTGGCSVRAMAGKRMGMAYSERLDPAAVGEAVKMAVKNAQYMDDDVGNGLNESSGDLVQDETGKDPWPSDEDAKRFVIELEQACKDLDPRVSNVPGTGYGYFGTQVGIATGAGLHRSFSDFIGYAYTYVMVSEKDETETASYMMCGRDPRTIDPKRITKMAVERALEQLGATEPKSGTPRCVIHGECAGSLVGAFMSTISAEAMQKGASKLKGRLGEKIGCELFTIMDDPSAPGLGRRHFDDEGVDSPTIAIFRKGVFENPIYSIYSARREGKASNGRGIRQSIQGRAVASLINGFIPDGSSSFQNLLRETGQGILITNLEGLHAGLNEVSGDFSCAAKGFTIENGKKGHALRNFTISGNFYELIKHIVALGDDRRTDDYATFTSPSLMLESITVSGR